ncbi:MAG: hypothetical protein EXX96DRAFT_649451 [Benjaminiella poitrasii]|nr:MAG: hypothetical protein EXX96DRAFT_649451 [Benjaminiella poitrasii]
MDKQKPSTISDLLVFYDIYKFCAVEANKKKYDDTKEKNDSSKLSIICKHMLLDLSYNSPALQHDLSIVGLSISRMKLTVRELCNPKGVVCVSKITKELYYPVHMLEWGSEMLEICEELWISRMEIERRFIAVCTTRKGSAKAAEWRDYYNKLWRRATNLVHIQWWHAHCQVFKRFRHDILYQKCRRKQFSTFSHLDGPLRAATVMADLLSTVFDGHGFDRPPRFLDFGFSRSLFTASSDCDPASLFPANNIASQNMLLSRRKIPSIDHFRAEMLIPIRHELAQALSPLLHMQHNGQYPVVDFLDIKVAYDTFDRNIIWRALHQSRTHPPLLGLLQHLFDEVQIAVLFDNRI